MKQFKIAGISAPGESGRQLFGSGFVVHGDGVDTPPTPFVARHGTRWFRIGTVRKLAQSGLLAFDVVEQSDKEPLPDRGELVFP